MGKFIWVIFWIAAVLIVVGGVSAIMRGNVGNYGLYNTNNEQQEAGQSTSSYQAVEVINYAQAPAAQNNSQSATGMSQIDSAPSATLSQAALDMDTKSALSVDEYQATLRGLVDLGGAGEVEVWFEWDDRRSKVEDGDGSVLFINGAYNTNQYFEKRLYSLIQDETYYYRACGEDAAGDKDCGKVKSFRTDEDDVYDFSNIGNNHSYINNNNDDEVEDDVYEEFVINLGDTIAVDDIVTKFVNIYSTCLPGMQCIWDNPASDFQFRQGSSIEDYTGAQIGDHTDLFGYSIEILKLDLSNEKALLRITN